jgi:hypothetical protein
MISISEWVAFVLVCVVLSACCIGLVAVARPKDGE